MEKKEYLALDIYSKSELQDALSFAPRLGWSLHSLQDVLSRSDAAHFSLSKKDRECFSTNSLSGQTFDEYVHGKLPSSLSENKRTETHITSYTKAIFERDNRKRKKEDILIENNWVNLLKLENKIFSVGNSQDYSSVHDARKRGNAAFIVGLIFGALASFCWIFNLSFASIDASSEGSLAIAKNIFFFGAIGSSALALFFLIPSFCALLGSSHAVHKAKKNRKMWAKDYKTVIELKHEFERMYIEGKKPRFNRKWFKLMCRRYGFSFYKIRYR